MLEQALYYANLLAKNFPWEVIAASGVLSPLLVGIKKWFSVQSEKVMISLVMLLSLLTVVVNYLLRVPTTNPQYLAVQAAVLAFMTQPVYFFIVKPAIYSFRSYVEKAAKFNAEVKSAAVPAAGLTPPTVTTTPPSAPITTVPAQQPEKPVVIEDFR